jgi:hypothetical protein
VCWFFSGRIVLHCFPKGKARSAKKQVAVFQKKQVRRNVCLQTGVSLA